MTDRSFLRLFGVRNRVYLVENAQNHAVVLDLRGNDMSVQFEPDLAALSWCGAVCLQPADPSGWKVTPSDHRHKHSRDKATSPQLIRFCLFVTLFYFDNVHCNPSYGMGVAIPIPHDARIQGSTCHAVSASFFSVA